jgi:hypothetical protein
MNLELLKRICKHLECPEFSLRRACFVWDWHSGALAGILITIFFVGMRTLGTPPAPLYDEYGEATAYHSNGFTVIEYERYYKVRHNFSGTVSRVVECKGIRTFDVPPTLRPFTKGDHHTSRTIAIPVKFPLGAECTMRTFIEWRPRFSLAEHLYEIEPVKFVVLGGNDGKAD